MKVMKTKAGYLATEKAGKVTLFMRGSCFKDLVIGIAEMKQKIINCEAAKGRELVQ